MGIRGKVSLANVIAQQRGQYQADEPEMPKNLPPDAKKEWRRIVNLLRMRGVLDALDEASLHDYLVCWSRLRECEADIAERGVLIPGDRGKVKNPSVQLARQYRDAFVAWCREFGFTVAARTRLSIGNAKDPSVNPFARFDQQTDELEQLINQPRVKQ